MGYKTSISGIKKFSLDIPKDKKVDVISLNWCDSCTWYQTSELVDRKTVVPSGSLSIPFGDSNIIDVTHGRLSDENLLTSYTPKIWIDDTLLTEDSPEATDNDYTIDYENGIATLNTALSGSEVVEVEYHKSINANWVITPDSGKVIRIAFIEVQFSYDFILNDTVLFEVCGYVDVFAPHLLTTADPPGPYPPGTKIPLGNAKTYKTMQDYINDAAGSYPEIPKLGGTSWRGMNDKIAIFRWPYDKRGTTDLISSYGMELRITLENNIAFGGSVAVATMYGISIDEDEYL